MIFEPQPLEFFKGYDAPPRINSLREKVEYLAELGVDYIAVAKFDQHFRSMSASQFADLLKDKLNAQALVLGDDFHFGKDRQGNSEFLKIMASKSQIYIPLNLKVNASVQPVFAKYFKWVILL